MEELEIVLETEDTEGQVLSLEEENSDETIELSAEDTINISMNASDISYEDTYGYGTENVQDTLDSISDLINNLEEKSIKTLHNINIDLRTLPIGIYYVTGTSTTFKYTDTKTKEDIITSDTQKVVLITLGAYGSYGRGVIFDGRGNYATTFLHIFGNGLYNNVNLNNLVTTSTDKTITAQWTFNKAPVCPSNPTSNHQLANKSYVDRKASSVKHPTDLGYIELEDYDDDIDVFISTLTDEGRYTFVDSSDEFNWYVEVYRTGNAMGQTYWCEEEGFRYKYFRQGWYNEDEDTYEWGEWDDYVLYSTAISIFAHKNHVHYITTSVSDLRTWLDEMTAFSTKEYEVIQTSNKHKFMVNIRHTSYTIDGKTSYIRYQEYYDIEEPNKIYKRTGRASNNTSTATITWGDWYVFEGVVE